jgi:hypothetical protein
MGCQMQRIKLLGALVALTFSGVGFAQTTLECGNVACAGNDPSEELYGTATGIDNIVVDGNTFDVTFTHTLPSSPPFLVSNYASAPGQPLTGVDAANALESFLATQLEPSPNLVGGGPSIVTAFGVDPTTGVFSYDVVHTFFLSVYVPYKPVSVVPDESTGPIALFTGSANGNLCPAAICTVWTPISAAPEISPASALSALTLLLGGILVLRGRRPVQLA